MNKMDGKSMDLTAENIAQLKKLFPEAVTEGKVDFEVLKALLGGEIETRQEYYKFTWNGKETARAYARTPSKGTLRPCVEESSGKDGTPGKFDSENLYIEGDNLEVLKLLQGSYHKKIKMIYIDPPYNTGKDFVYPDNYQDSIKNYKKLTSQTDTEGKSTRANPETSGRYHTDWLNMMYPRLILARNLLTDDGVIFISIDDSEQDNLKKLCNEVFGEENFVAQIIWKRKRGRDNSAKWFSKSHEYSVIYSRNKDYFNTNFLELDDTTKAAYKNPDNDYRGVYRMLGCWARGTQGGVEYDFTTKDGQYFSKRLWLFSKESLQKLDREDKLIIRGDNVYRKMFISENQGKIPETLWDSVSNGANASDEIKKLFDNLIFDTPKPLPYIEEMLRIASNSDSVILDFFSGSATTAHAVMQLNAEDGGNRKYIMVQLPEPCVEGTEAAKAGYKNICEIGKERIRRAANKLRAEKPLDCQGKDMGFKVFKLDTSNLREWNPNSDTLAQDLLDAVNNILAGRTTEDLLYEVLLKCNLPLTLPIEERKVESVTANGKTQTNTIYVVGMGALAICLDENIPQTIAEEIVKLRNEYAPVVPMQVVFRDNGFDDVSKTNALQILKQAGFEEKSIQTI